MNVDCVSRSAARQRGLPPSGIRGPAEKAPSSSTRQLEPLPSEIAFLSAYGAPPSLLVEAAALARTQAVTPEAALLATGSVTEAYYYQALAAHLGVAFISGAIELGAGARYPHSIHAGVAPIAGEGGPRWLVAPRGEMLTRLLRRRQNGEKLGASLAIATPGHLSRLVRVAAAPAIAREASLALADRDPDLSAKSGISAPQCCVAAVAVAAAGLVCAFVPDFGPSALTIATSVLFLAALCLRLFAAAASPPPTPISAPCPPCRIDSCQPIRSSSRCTAKRGSSASSPRR